jgi:hypothetical protein
MHLENFSSWARFFGELALVPPPISLAQEFPDGCCSSHVAACAPALQMGL